MVRLSFAGLLLAGCATWVPTSTGAVMTAPKKAATIDPRRFQPCSELVDSPESSAPGWEPMVLATDVTTWSSGACEPLERALTPLPQATLGRQALRDECDKKSTVLPAAVRSSCRAVCAARRWVDGRTLARQRVLHTLEWARDEFDSLFDRIEQCPATKKHGNQLADAQVRSLLECAGKGPMPKEVTFLFQYVTETVEWREQGSGTITSSRAVEAQFLQAGDADANFPWRAMVTRCRNGKALERVLVRP